MRLFAGSAGPGGGRGRAPTDTSPVWPVPRGDLLPVERIHAAAGGAAGHLRRRALGAAGQRRGRAACGGDGSCKGICSCSSRSWRTSRRSSVNINRFFSGDGAKDTTYFTRPAVRPAGRAEPVEAVSLGGDWAAFVADPDNPVARALHDAAENRDRGARPAQPDARSPAGAPGRGGDGAGAGSCTAGRAPNWTCARCHPRNRRS